MTDKRRPYSEWTNFKCWAWYLVTYHARQVAEMHRKKRRRQIPSQTGLKCEHAARRPPYVNVGSRVKEWTKKPQSLYVIHVQMSE
jgi:hypothetical protein